MARKKKEDKSPKAKVRQRKKVEVQVTPRLRLEPRLTPQPSKKIRVSEDHRGEKGSISFEKNELEGNTSQHGECYEEGMHVMSNCEEEQRRETVDAMSSCAAKESTSYETTSCETEVPQRNNEFEKNNYSEEVTIGINRMKPKRRKHGVMRKGYDWNDRERMDLAISLQTHGFSDLKKLADCVKTKSESEIKQYIKLRRTDACYKPDEPKPNRQGNRWNTLCPKFLASWPNIRKWRKLAYEQMLLYTRSKDYSKPVISALCKKFYEEEEEPADPQVINVKLIYKYMMDCMAGEIPPQLPPKESTLVLDLLREVRLMPIAYDFEEERKFLQDFRTATKFKPFQVKDEFKKRYKKESEDDAYSLNTIAVPEEVFLDLSRHKRLTQSFSPLVTPVWMLQKEQELLEKHAEESNVYVD